MNKQKTLNQFFTPVWAAEILFNEHFSHLTEKDLVWEPTCGPGSFLSAIPNHIPAIGSDLDPEMVELARINTNRPTYHGDFRSIEFDQINEVTSVIGNPPFQCELFEQFMERCENILKIGNKAGFVIPAYFFQTSKTFKRFARKWDIKQEIIPRDLFKDGGLLTKPLIFATFVRDDNPQLFGFRLHTELADVDSLKSEIKEILNNKVKRTGSIWKEVLIDVMTKVGGIATLDEVYKNVEGKRPTENPFWKEQVRKLIQQAPFKRVDNATYKLVA